MLEEFKDESVQQYYSRLYRSEEMRHRYSLDDQRHIVCMTKASHNLTGFEYSDFWHGVKQYGFTEDVTEENFVVPPEAAYVEDWAEEAEEWDISEAKPGLWENIRKKKEREGKKYRPAKPGDPDRPDPDAWKKAQSDEREYMFSKKEDAEKVAEELGMNGVHSHKSEDGRTLWMPGNSHEEFMTWYNKKSKGAYVYEDPMTNQLFYFSRQGNYYSDGRRLVFVEKSEGAEYQGRKVTLNKPFRTPKGPKKFAVYTKNQKGTVVIVRFGDPNMKIKKNDPARRKSFRARHNCDNPGPKWKARYWSCRAW